LTKSTAGSERGGRSIMLLLGLSQIIGYGTLYYSFAILAGAVAADLGWPQSWLFGAFSAGLFLGGLTAPLIGRRIDRHGGPRVMSLGSLAAAAALFVAAAAPNGWLFALAVIAMQLAGTLVLYDAAFAALVQATGPSARKRITQLTLIAGFASTIFWPLTTALHGFLHWRVIFVAFALVNLLVCLPVHLWLAHQRRAISITPSGDAVVPPVVKGSVPTALQGRALWLATLGFALSGFTLSAMLTQMVPLLTTLGLGASALVVSTLFGPSQVLVRFLNMLLAGKRDPMAATLLALLLLPLALAILISSAPMVIGAAVFAVLLGFGSGLKSIVQGTLPLALFGAEAYGARLGHMASVRQALSAFAPFVVAALSEAIGVHAALWVTVAIGLVGLGAMAAIVPMIRRSARAG
jgi:MFS family permease